MTYPAGTLIKNSKAPGTNYLYSLIIQDDLLLGFFVDGWNPALAPVSKYTTQQYWEIYSEAFQEDQP